MSFWRGKRVFLTGHTGFKGAWLALWLTELGAEVTGYSLPAPTDPNLFEVADVRKGLRHLDGDIRDLTLLTQSLGEARPEIVIHMAAQSLVRLSYDEPISTYATNVMGTANVLEAVRRVTGVRSVVCVTSDKCYENREVDVGYTENDAMGGYDPYSSSKGCSELVIAAYRRSYFHPGRIAEHGVGIASGRAGNVIGGGDWAKDRLIPDLVRGFSSDVRPVVRFPGAIRPWQHVLEPLSGYLKLAEHLWRAEVFAASGWNFGPEAQDARPVGWIADRLADLWGQGAGWDATGEPQPHEAGLLKLDWTKARTQLGWTPTWSLETCLKSIVEWQKSYNAGGDMRALTLQQIRAHAGATETAQSAR